MRCLPQPGSLKQHHTFFIPSNFIGKNKFLTRQKSSHLWLRASDAALEKSVKTEHLDEHAAPINTKTTLHPHDLTLTEGELSEVQRDALTLPEDQYQEPSDNSQAWRMEPNGYLLQTLNARVYDVAVISPLEKAHVLSSMLGNTVLLKREDVQQVFSFKLRGAYNKMTSLSKEELAKGVICSSAGNHAQGVALSARKLGCNAIICMPTTTPSIKVEAVKRLGATVVLVGESYQETQAYAMERAAKDNLAFVPPYDDPYTIAGQGTIGKEILEQVSSQENLKTIFVAVGGGGLIAGIGSYIKSVRPDIKVIGVEPSGANAMAMSLAAGFRVSLPYVDSFADGVAVKQVGKETYRLCKDVVDGIVLVHNSSISAAIKDVYSETRSILEPAGAVAVAGAKAYLKHHNLQGETVVAVCSGANINFNNLRRVADLADVGANREAVLVTTIPEASGSFKQFVETILHGRDIMITEFKYRYSAGPNANILWSAGVNSEYELAQLVNELNAEGNTTMDISNVEEALDFMRAFSGGRAHMDEILEEEVWKVSFPERVGSLLHFLDSISPRWNVTMFCYRSDGNAASSALLGIQVPQVDQLIFHETIVNQKDYIFTPLSEKADKVRRMLI